MKFSSLPFQKLFQRSIMPQPKSCVFPYGIKLRKDMAIETFPAARISIPLKNGEEVSLIFLIDSGAAISALPKNDAPFLGISLKNGQVMSISGISSEPIKGWRYEINVMLGKETLNLPIIFLDVPSAPRVLGRAGIFNIFTVIFEENSQRTCLLKNETPEARRIQDIINDLS